MLALFLSLTLGQAPARAIAVNGAPLTAARLKTLERVERTGPKLPNGAWWYDPISGAFGAWGGPTISWIVPGLDLGPACPANASGASGGVAINGRWLHPLDVQRLSAWLRSPLLPGRYRVDAQGNAWLENGMYLFNLFAIANAAPRSNGSANAGISVLERDFSVVGDGKFMGACTKHGCAYIE